MLITKFARYARHFSTEAALQSNPRKEWKSVIGLEIHVQLSTESKLFSSATADYGLPTNSAVSLLDAAIPGSLPCLNKKAVELAAKTALALGCKINPVSYFDRKHYFYSDLPAGYQITQQRLPLAENGRIDYAVYQPGVHRKPYYKTSYIKQIQIEQDSGKMFHEDSEKQCYVDLNRAGTALVEIVFLPDVDDGYEATALVKEIIWILKKIQTCTCKMEEGALRVDANVSVHQSGSELGVRTEIKNLGSLSALTKAIQYETQRQIDILSNGGVVKNETLMWDTDRNKTRSMREKEDLLDYRFMPEPNLPPLRLLIDEYSENIHKNVKPKSHILNIKKLKEELPTMPQEERNILIEKYGLSHAFAFNIVANHQLLELFKEIMKEKPGRDAQVVNSVLMFYLPHQLKNLNLKLEDCKMQSWQFGEVVDLIQNRKVSKAVSNQLLKEIVTQGSGLSPVQFVKSNNLYLISNPKEVRKLCMKVLEKEEEVVAMYKRKKKKSVLKELAKKVVEESKMRADENLVYATLIEILDELSSND